MRTFQATMVSSHSWRGLGPLLLMVVLACLGDAARAQDAVATVTHLDGLPTARREDGSMRLLATRSVIHEGEMLVTGSDSYLEIQFVDDATLTLGPASRVHVTRYAWNPEHPAADRVVLELLAGSLRSVTGRLGQRNHDAIRIEVSGSEIAVHGTDFIVQTVSATPSPSAPLPRGLYVQVLNGMISVSNAGGSNNFNAGQFGFTSNQQQPPVILPKNPGVQFTPPPTFSSTSSQAATTANSTNSVDCEVR